MRAAVLVIAVMALSACGRDPVLPSAPTVDLHGTLDGQAYRDSGSAVSQAFDGREWLVVAGSDHLHTEGMIVLELYSDLEQVFSGSANASADLCARTLRMPMEEVEDVPWTLRTKPTVVDGIVKVSLHAWTEPDTTEDADIDLTATFFFDLDEGVPTPPP